MALKFSKISVIFVLIFQVCLLHSQTRKSLEQYRKQTEREISRTSSLLKDVEQSSKTSYEQFLLLKSKISSIKRKIGTEGNEIRAINGDLKRNERRFSNNSSQIKNLKEEYAKLIVSAYKYKKRQDKLMFIFSSKSFNQAYRRFKYIGSYIDYRKHQVQKIRSLQSNLKNIINTLEQDKKLRNNRIKSIEVSNYKLVNEKEKINLLVTKLKREKKILLKDLNKKQELTADINNRINRLLNEEIKRERKRNLNKNLSLKKRKALENLTDGFKREKGKLLWPIDGVITSKYGVHKHPILKYIQIKNNGITITAKKNSDIKVVYDGVVARIYTVRGNQAQTILIKHGKFYTVYNNVLNKRVLLKQKVTRGQIIGKIATVDNQTNMEFHIRKITDGIASETLNPEKWLLRQ